LGHSSTVFAQVLRLVPRHVFERLAAWHHTGARLRRASRWSQLVALGLAHLGGRASLRDVVASLEAQAPRLYHLGARPLTRSTLARVFRASWQRCRVHYADVRIMPSLGLGLGGRAGIAGAGAA
jgi:hypothetical protein